MTGIERLREFAKGCRLVGQKAYSNAIGDIADQIELEHAEDCFKMGERAAEDAEAIAWVREHGGLEAVREACSPGRPSDNRKNFYDRLVLAWVEEHGGIEHVKAHWSGRVALSHVHNMAERQRARRERMQRHIEFVQRKCRERQEHICELNKLKRAYIDALNGVCKRLGLTDGTGLPDMPEVIWAELDRRLMPEGMEWLVEAWPRFEDGEPVKFGDKVPTIQRVSKIGLFCDSSFTLYNGFDSVPFKRGERVKRPAPKVLDANGVEIRVGDEVWNLDGTRHGIVSMVGEWDESPLRRLIKIEGDPCWHQANRFTHRAPVLAADGKPLREGETVYHIKTGDSFTVIAVGAEFVHLRWGYDFEDKTGTCSPHLLTHERPDSWERLEDDADKSPCEYYEIDASASCKDCPAYMKESPDGDKPIGCRYEQKRDLVRRARALADRSEK